MTTAPIHTEGIEDDEVEELSVMLRAVKARHGWTLDEMARRCPSVSKATLNNILRGVPVHARTLAAVLDDLDKSPLELRGWYAQWLRLRMFSE